MILATCVATFDTPACLRLNCNQLCVRKQRNVVALGVFHLWSKAIGFEGNFHTTLHNLHRLFKRMPGVQTTVHETLCQKVCQVDAANSVMDRVQWTPHEPSNNAPVCHFHFPQWTGSRKSFESSTHVGLGIQEVDKFDFSAKNYGRGIHVFIMVESTGSHQ